jgi:hypothetical protein
MGLGEYFGSAVCHSPRNYSVALLMNTTDVHPYAESLHLLPEEQRHLQCIE